MNIFYSIILVLLVMILILLLCSVIMAGQQNKKFEENFFKMECQYRNQPPSVRPTVMASRTPYPGGVSKRRVISMGEKYIEPESDK